jgi:hypothetical protein
MSESEGQPLDVVLLRQQMIDTIHKTSRNDLKGRRFRKMIGTGGVLPD